MAEKILTSSQEKFLKFFGREKYLPKRFYLTGGTALAAFYLFHRRSEDLDFFSEKEFALAPLRAFIQKYGGCFNIQKIDIERFFGLYSFFLHISDREKLKVDFNYYPYPRIEKGIIWRGIIIDSVYDIAVNKVHTIATKARARDFIDIYFIIKEMKYDFHDLLMKAKANFDWHIDPVQLGTQLLKAREVVDFPKMLKEINHNEWRAFFIEEAKKLKKDIFK